MLKNESTDVRSTCMIPCRWSSQWLYGWQGPVWWEGRRLGFELFSRKSMHSRYGGYGVIVNDRPNFDRLRRESFRVLIMVKDHTSIMRIGRWGIDEVEDVYRLTMMTATPEMLQDNCKFKLQMTMVAERGPGSRRPKANAANRQSQRRPYHITIEVLQIWTLHQSNTVQYQSAVSTGIYSTKWPLFTAHNQASTSQRSTASSLASLTECFLFFTRIDLATVGGKTSQLSSLPGPTRWYYRNNVERFFDWTNDERDYPRKWRRRSWLEEVGLPARIN